MSENDNKIALKPRKQKTSELKIEKEQLEQLMTVSARKMHKLKKEAGMIKPRSEKQIENWNKLQEARKKAREAKLQEEQEKEKTIVHLKVKPRKPPVPKRPIKTVKKPVRTMETEVSETEPEESTQVSETEPEVRVARKKAQKKIAVVKQINEQLETLKGGNTYSSYFDRLKW